MTLPGETIGTGASEVCECGNTVVWGVYQSGAGWYIGTYCPECGPYSRESKYYYPTKEEAQEALDNNTWVRRDTQFNG